MAPITGELGLAEAAAALKIPYQDCHRLMLIGRLAGEKRGGRWVVQLKDVDRLIRERQLETSVRAAGHR